MKDRIMAVNYDNKSITLGNLAEFHAQLLSYIGRRMMTSEDTNSMMQRVLGAND